MVQVNYSTDTSTTWKDFRFILSKTLAFHMVINLSIKVYALIIRILKSHSVDGMNTLTSKKDNKWQSTIAVGSVSTLS